MFMRIGKPTHGFQIRRGPSGKWFSKIVRLNNGQTVWTSQDYEGGWREARDSVEAAAKNTGWPIDDEHDGFQRVHLGCLALALLALVLLPSCGALGIATSEDLAIIHDRVEASEKAITAKIREVEAAVPEMKAVADVVHETFGGTKAEVRAGMERAKERGELATEKVVGLVFAVAGIGDAVVWFLRNRTRRRDLGITKVRAARA